jgi:hypothetical protein
MKATNNTEGCFILENGFPDEYYAFTDGEISATVERHGGINTIGCLDIYEQDGKLYPDQRMSPVIFQKEGSHCEKRPLYGPAVQFISTLNGPLGKNLFHFPDKVVLYPFGFKSESFRFDGRTSYDMAIDGKQVLFSFTNSFPTRQDFVISINKDHIYQGATGTHKSLLPKIKKNQQFPPLEGKQKWNFIGFDPIRNGLSFGGEIQFKHGVKPVFVLLTSNKTITFSENKNRYFLTIPWEDSEEIRLSLVIGSSLDEVGTKAKNALNELKKTFAKKIIENENYSNKATKLSAENFPEVEEFSRTAPSFLRSMILTDNDIETCIRAATHKFGFFIIWDQVWPAKAFLLMGDWQTAAKLIRYPLSCLKGDEKQYEILYLTLFIITIAEDIIAVSGDYEFENQIYEELKRLFLIYLERASNNGLLPANGACGVDDPAEIGIEGDVWPSCLNSLWYNACRAMENMALKNGDRKIAELAGAQEKLIKANYLKIFYQSEYGYLYSSVDIKTGRGIPIYQNVGTLGMDFAYGEWLLKDQIKEIAKFQAQQLYHPAGRSAVPYWDTSHEMWKNVIMYQHITHEMRIARSAGLTDEIERMMKVYLGHFHRNKVAIETHNLTGADGDISQRANWQAFGTRALYSGIFEALIGIQCHLGGLHYVPGNIKGKVSIENFKFRKSVWDITINGEGHFCHDIVIDGEKIPGVLQVPQKYLNDNRHHKLIVERVDAPFSVPTLLSAIGAEISNVNSDKNNLIFNIKQPVHTTIKCFCPEKPVCKINGKPTCIEWDRQNNLVWIDLIIAHETKVIISC